MKKTALSIGLLTVLYGAGAWAQAPTQQAGPAQQAAPTQQTAPRGDPRAQAPSSSAPARDRAGAQADARTDDAKSSENQHRELQVADTNMDGLVSRQEYMAHYEGLYEELKKDSAGMINLEDLTASTTASQPTR